MYSKVAVKLLIILIIIGLMSSLAYGTTDSSNDVLPEIDASSAMVVEPSIGQVVYEKNPSQRLHVSSANKIMTALIAIEKVKPDAIVAISKESLDVSGSLLMIEAGEKFTVEELLYATLLTPANDATSALAEYVGESTNNFVAMMNAKAKELNMADTVFKNPTGLYDEEQYTTAKDISLLVCHALKDPLFKRIFSTKGRPFNSQIIINHNKLLWQYEGADGGKAGYTDKDQYSAITTATRGTQSFMSIVLNSSNESIWNDSIKIFDFAFNNFRTGLLIKSRQVMHKIKVENQDVNLISSNDVYYTYPLGEDNIQNIQFHINKDLKLPLQASVPVGTAQYTLKDNTKINVALYPEESILPLESKKDYILKTVEENIVLIRIVIILIILEIFLIIRKIILSISRLIKKHRDRAS